MRRVLSILMYICLATASFGLETELTPCAEDSASILPTCCLKSDGLNFVLYRGTKVVYRFNYSRGANISPSDGAYDRVLPTALKTMKEMKSAGGCN